VTGLSIEVSTLPYKSRVLVDQTPTLSAPCPQQVGARKQSGRHEFWGYGGTVHQHSRHAVDPGGLCDFKMLPRVISIALARGPVVQCFI